MRSELLEELKDITLFLSERNRMSSTSGLREAQNFVKKFLENHSIPYKEETFEVEKNIPLEATLKVNNTELPAFPFVNSLWGEREAYVVSETEKIEGNIALLKVSKKREEDKIKEVKEKSAIGAVFYIEELDSPFIGNLGSESFFAVSVSREVARDIVGKKVRLISKVHKARIKGRNIYFDIGKGPFLYVIAHIDSKPFVKGAIDNAAGVSLVLMVAKELKDSYHFPFRLRFLITDCEELGLEGSRYHVRNLKHTYFVINVDAVGWFNPAVIYKDAKGYNGEKIMSKFDKHLKDLKVNIPFRETKRGMSDHIPFKEKGIETLFLSSNPFTLRHTFYDTYSSIDWNSMELWYEVLSSFLRRFHKL